MNRLAAPDEPPVTYVPGAWLAIVTDDLCVLADVAADSRTLGACWSAAVTGQGLDAVVTLLVEAGVTDYAAATRTDEGLRTLLSGAGSAEVDGAEVTASDEVVAGRPAVRLTSGGTAEPEWTVLPLLRGMAPAAAVGIGISAAVPAAPSVPEPEPEPEFEPEPEPEAEPIRLPDEPPEPAPGLLESLTWREAAPVAGPLVMSIACPRDHPNPPWAQTCRECGVAVPAQQPFLMPRPALGALALATGEVVTLDRDVVFGRQPTSDTGATLVPLATAVNDVSRNHARIALSDWLVQVVDLDSTNGTTVTLPGEAAVALRPHDPFTILPGSTIAIGHDVTMRYELP